HLGCCPSGGCFMLVIRCCSSLRPRSLVASWALCLAAGCSAPPGTDTDDGPAVPPYEVGSNANQPATVNANGTPANGTPANGANPGRTGEGNPGGVQVNNGNTMPAGNNSAGAGGAPATMT